MRRTFRKLARLLAVVALMWLTVAGADEPPDTAKETAKEKAAKAKEAAKEKADKAKQAARERAKKALRTKVLQTLGSMPDGYFLVALEEVAGPKVTSVTIVLKDGRDVAAGDITDYLNDSGKQTRRSYQVIARLERTARGEQLAKSHQSNLQRFVDVRLNEPTFSLDPCYSDLAGGGKSINQGLAEGTVVKYLPFR